MVLRVAIMNLTATMKPKSRLSNSCLFCCKFVRTTQPQCSRLYREIAGAVKCSELEAQLYHVFVLRKLLDVPALWCEQVLEEHGENPAAWFKICNECGELVAQGWELYQEILGLEGGMREVKRKICRLVRESWSGKKKRGIESEIWRVVCGDYSTSHFPFDHHRGSVINESNPAESSQTCKSIGSDHHDDDEFAHYDVLSDDDSDPVVHPTPTPAKRKRRKLYKRRKVSDDVLKPSLIKYSKKCKVCGFRYKTRAQFEDHVAAHEESSLNGGAFNCEVCMFPGRNEVELKEHKEKEHKFKKTYKCNVCEFETEFIMELKRHTDQLHPDVKEEDLSSDLVPKCSACSKEFDKLRSVVVHQRRMHPELFIGASDKHLLVQCDKCEMRFANELHLQFHVSSVHFTVRTYICDVCGKGFPFAVNLDRHKVSHQTGKKEFVCEICGLDYAYRSALDEHSRKVHAPKSNDEHVDVHKCKYCDLTSPFKTVIQRYLETHKAELGVQCDECKKYFTNLSGLKLHKKNLHSSTSEAYNCPYCFKAFGSMHYVTCHVGRFCKVKKALSKDVVIN